MSYFVLFWGHCYPCFGFLVMCLLGLNARLGSALLTFVEIHLVYGHHTLPYMHQQRSWIRIDWTITHREDEDTTLCLLLQLILTWVKLSVMSYHSITILILGITNYKLLCPVLNNHKQNTINTHQSRTKGFFFELFF